MMSTPHCNSGFSKLELFLCIALTVLAGLIFIPWFTQSTATPNHTRLIANGMGIYRSVFAEIADVQAVLEKNEGVPFPLSHSNTATPNLKFENSTDYFVYLVSNDILPVNWSYFSGANIVSAPGKFDSGNLVATQNFKAENNAWSVVADLNIEDFEVPFLITRNLQTDRLRITSKKPILEGPPYDDKRLVVIRIGGSGEVLRKRDIRWGNINPTDAQNLILRP